MRNNFDHPSQESGNDGNGEVEHEWSVEEGTSEDDRREFFTLFHNVHGLTDSLEQRIQSSLKYYDRMPKAIFGNGERRQFLIRDQDRHAVAGAEVIIGEKDGRREAYFGHKVVDVEYRGRDLGRMLVEERLRRAREVGCVEAWSLVEQNNIAALRSINKDGFRILGNGFSKTGNDVSRDTYYVARDLTAELPALHTIEEIVSIEPAQKQEQLVGNRILISLDNKELVQFALERGYIGTQVILPKDSPRIRKPMLFMERVLHDEQDPTLDDKSEEEVQ